MLVERSAQSDHEAAQRGESAAAAWLAPAHAAASRGWPSVSTVVIDWPDFGVPTAPDEAREEIVAAFERASGAESDPQ